MPELAIEEGEAPAPIRFLPEYDNILIAHKDRRRILPEEHRKKVFVSAGRVLGSVIIDGFVGAIWSLRREKARATLQVSLFEAQAHDLRAAIEEEGLALLRFIADDAEDYAVELAEYT